MAAKRPPRFAETLETLIAERGYARKKKEVARQVSVTSSALSQYLSGGATPRFKTLVALTEFFDVSLDYLVFGATHEVQPRTADFGPAVRYVDRSLADLQAKIDRQTRLFGLLTEELSKELTKASEKLARRGASEGGVITDGETEILEAYSTDTWIVALDLTNDIIKEGAEEAAARFLPVVASNISKGRKYRFLLPKHVGDWDPIVKSYINNLRNLCNNDDLVIRNCAFRKTDTRIISGCGMYKLDVEALRAEQPIKYTRFEQWIVDARLGYAIAASRALQVDSLMDSNHLHHALQSFDQMWKQGKPVGR